MDYGSPYNLNMLELLPLLPLACRKQKSFQAGKNVMGVIQFPSVCGGNEAISNLELEFRGSSS